MAAYAALGAGLVWTSRRGLAVAWRNSPSTGGLLIFILWLTAGICRRWPDRN